MCVSGVLPAVATPFGVNATRIRSKHWWDGHLSRHSARLNGILHGQDAHATGGNEPRHMTSSSTPIDDDFAKLFAGFEAFVGGDAFVGLEHFVDDRGE